MKKPITSKLLTRVALVSFFALILSLTSCRKYDEKSGYIPSVKAEADIKVTQELINDWFQQYYPLDRSSGTEGPQYQIQWSKAKQSVVEGKHVVRVPVGKDQYFVFSRTNPQASLRVYFYFRINEKPNEKEFTGKVYWYNFRTHQMRSQQFINDNPGMVHILPFKDPEDLKTLKAGPNAKEEGGMNKMAILIMPNRSRYLKLIYALNRYLVSNNVNLFNSDLGDEGDLIKSELFLYPDESSGFTGDDITQIFNEIDFSWVDHNPTNALNLLTADLMLNQTEIDYILGPYAPSNFAKNLYKYLYEYESPYLSEIEKLLATKNHASAAVANNDYQDFVENQNLTLPWWENIDWLSNSTNLTLAINSNFFGIINDAPISNEDPVPTDFVTTCPANFSFVSVTTNDLWQEGKMTNIYCNLGVFDPGLMQFTTTRQATISHAYIGMPYKSVEGSVIYSNTTAKSLANDSFNLAEGDMRRMFKQNPSLSSSQLSSYWLKRWDVRLKELTKGRGRVNLYGTQNPTETVPSREYDPGC